LGWLGVAVKRFYGSPLRVCRAMRRGLAKRQMINTLWRTLDTPPTV
jgi:hypothetical protein